jgi:hypothetical protein
VWLLLSDLNPFRPGYANVSDRTVGAAIRRRLRQMQRSRVIDFVVMRRPLAAHLVSNPCDHHGVQHGNSPSTSALSPEDDHFAASRAGCLWVSNWQFSR